MNSGTNAGDFFILHPNTYHHYYSDKNDPWKKIFLTIDGDPKFVNALLSLYKIENVCYLHKTNSPFQLEEIFELVKSGETDIDHELEELVMRMVTNISDFYYSHHSNASDKLSAAKSFIERRVSTKLSVNEVADFAGFERAYFSKKFSSRYGLSPSEYIMLSKIEYAMNLLLNSDMSVKTISEQLSFTDTSHFSQRFHRYTGYTPAEFRSTFKTKA